MKIYIGNDHTGVEMKQFISKHLESKGFEVINIGTDSTEPADYPEIGKEVASKVVADSDSKGILICGTGIGISIAANKVKGAIAALVYEEATAKVTRMHNNANIMATGARIIAKEKAIQLVDAFLSTEFEGGRHLPRVEKLLGEIK